LVNINTCNQMQLSLEQALIIFEKHY